MTTAHPVNIDTFSILVTDSRDAINHHSDEIIESLGGIDKILTEYIRISQQFETAELLSMDQIQRISDILRYSEAPPSTIWDRLYSKAKLQNDTFHLSRSDTVIHWIGNHHQNCDRLISFIFSKIAMLCASAVFFLWTLVFSMDSHLQTNSWLFGLELVVITILMVYTMMVILSSNRYAFLLVFSGFDLWMKLFYAVTGGIASVIYAQRTEDHSNIVVFQALTFVGLFLIIVMASLIEGYAASWKWSLALSLVLSLLASWQAIRTTLTVDWKESEFEIMSGVTIELTSYIAESFRVLSLFLWKQAIYTAYTKGKWCICIFLSPQIEWYDEGKRNGGDVDTAMEMQMQPESER